MSIFPNLCLWRRSLRSNLGGIDLEKRYRATLKPTLSAKTGRFDTNSSIEVAKKFRSPQVWQVWNEREQEKHFGWIFLLLYAMFVKLFTTQLNKIVSKRLCINSVCDDLTLIRHDHVSWSPSRLTAEIVVSSNFFALVFDKRWNTKKSLGVFLLTFSITTNNDADNYIYISSNWFWLRLRDTNMADSNRCQAVGHVGENQECCFLDNFQLHTLTPIRFMYSLKLTDTAVMGPYNNRQYNDFWHAPDFCNFIFQ